MAKEAPVSLRTGDRSSASAFRRRPVETSDLPSYLAPSSSSIRLLFNTESFMQTAT